MKIAIDLSVESVKRAINKLENIKANIAIDLSDVVDILAKEGADVANAAYGGMATASPFEEPFSGIPMTASAVIEVTGGDRAIIAEFGAGYATMEYHPFAKNAPVPIEVGSYSRENFGLFWATDMADPGHGYWYFGMQFAGSLGKGIYKYGNLFGNKMDRIQPRHGLLDAYDYIMQNSTNVAMEVIKL